MEMILIKAKIVMMEIQMIMMDARETVLPFKQGSPVLLLHNIVY